MENNKKEKVLSVKDLHIHFSTDRGYVQAVRGISFDLYKGETLCIVGESGSGKSVTSKSIMGILASNGRIKGGSILYEGEDLTKVSEDEFHRIRGHKIGMIFQDPLSSLNPIVRIGKQITEAMLVNNSRMKRFYQDKISKELIAYKNAETEKNSLIVNAKDSVNFLRIDKNKEADSYILHHQVVNSKIYDEEKKLNAKIVELSGEHETIVNPIREKIERLNLEVENYRLKGEDLVDGTLLDQIVDLNKELKKVNGEFESKVNAYKAEFKLKRKKLLSERHQEKRANKAAVKALKADFNRRIKASRKQSKVTIKEAIEKYDPIIKEKKQIYLLKCKEAKAEVKAYKDDLKKQYIANVKEITDNFELKIKDIDSNYSSSINGVTDSSVIEKETTAYKMHHKLAVANYKKDLEQAREKYIKSIKITRKEAKERALKIMAEVGIPNPEKRFKQYPFEFSGGMRQRIVIAIALTADPDILICDEPTTALDVTIQAQILELINSLKRTRELSCIFITHDLGVVANMADRVAVMYAGKIVEYGLANEIFYDPRHPYTWALLSSIPDVDSKEKLDAIPGTPPNMIYPPKGDAFALRSKYAMKIDFEKEPPLFKVSDTHFAATWLLDPRAPKVEMPKIVKTRIENSLKANSAKGEM